MGDKYSFRFRLTGVTALVVWLCLLSSSAVLGQDQAKAGKTVNKPKQLNKEIAITFDELPAAEGFTDVNVSLINDLLLKALDTHKVSAVGFVVASRTEGNYDVLGKWLNAKHKLGNLTFSHQDLHSLGAGNFIRDINSGHDALETMLAGFGQKHRYFRYPFLHYGETVEAKREVSQYLEAREVTVSHATVVVEDYLYNLSLDKIADKADSTEIDRLVDEYVVHVTAEVGRCEGLANEILKRNCRQILLLRANMLNALALDRLLTALEGIGYRFISLDRALEDDVFSAPDAYFGARGVGFLDMIRMAEPDLLPAE